MNPEVDAAGILRSYIWAVLKANDPTIWDESKYGGLVPIVPLSEEPELTQYSGPYIVYVYNHTPSEPPCNNGSMTLVIADTNSRRMGKSLNILSTALNRSDNTANDVNRYSSTKPPFVGIRFGYIKTTYSEGPAPSETEGGRDYALIALEYEYYVDYDVQTQV